MGILSQKSGAPAAATTKYKYIEQQRKRKTNKDQ